MNTYLRQILAITLYPIALLLSICSIILSLLRKHLVIYGDTPLSTTSEKETAFIQSQAHLEPGPNRIKRCAWHCSEVGSLSNLKLRTEYLDPPIPGYVQIKVHTIGLNFADVFAIQGLYSATPTHPFTPGLEFAGEIIALPPDASPEQLLVSGRPVQIGDRVHGVSRFGAFATHLNSSIMCLKALPAHWTYSEGASILVQALTAAYALFTLGGMNPTPLSHEQLRSLTPTTQFLPYKRQVTPSISTTPRRPVVLIHSAAGGVGLHALTMCLRTGAVPICTVSGRKKREYLVKKYKLLPEQVIDRALCGNLKVQHIPAQPKPYFLSHFKYYIKSCMRFIVSPIRTFLDNTICHRRKQAKDYGFLLDYSLKKVNQQAIDVSLDSLLGNWFTPTLQHMSCSNSKVVVFGAASYSSSGDYPDFLHLTHEYLRRPLIDPMDMIPLNTGICGFNLIWLWDQLHELHGLLNILDELIPTPVVNLTTFGVPMDMIQVPIAPPTPDVNTKSMTIGAINNNPKDDPSSVNNDTTIAASRPTPMQIIPNPRIVAPFPSLSTYSSTMISPISPSPSPLTSPSTLLNNPITSLSLDSFPTSSSNTPPSPRQQPIGLTSYGEVMNNVSHASFASSMASTTTTITSHNNNTQPPPHHPSVIYKFPHANGFLHLTEAIKLLQTGQHIGKIIVSVNHDRLFAGE